MTEKGTLNTAVLVRAELFFTTFTARSSALEPGIAWEMLYLVWAHPISAPFRLLTSVVL